MFKLIMRASPISPDAAEPVHRQREGIMPTIDPEKVCFVVIKAREFDVKVEPVEPNPGSNPADSGVGDVLQDYADDPTYEELGSFIKALNEEEQANLVALVWVGRGDFGKDEWDEVLAQARQQANDRTAEYLLGIPLLADYLEEGLAVFGQSCAEYEMGRL